jgi:hypothetical protein
VSDRVRLVGEMILWAAQLVGKAAAVSVHQDSALLVKIGLDAERGGDEAHQDGAKQGAR